MGLLAPKNQVTGTSGTGSVLPTIGTTDLGSVLVTTPSEIIPYYHLNHSISSLSDNKESSR
jgi:hypothetical protein